MSRPSLKRTIDLCDSPASSTPPQPAAKRMHYDVLSSYAASDASSDYFATPRDIPSDSPSNPFGRVRPYVPRGLPIPQPVHEHLVLRFRLATQQHNVSRVVCVPSNYTFWHLSRLVQFLFGWKDAKTERNPHNRHEKVLRRAEHAFSVQKDVALYGVAKHVGLIKSSRTAVHVTNSRKKYTEKVPFGVREEREEVFTLHHVWHRPGNSSELTRGVVYNYDTLSSRMQTVYVTAVSADAEKLRRRAEDVQFETESNEPYVVNGCGLPDDEEDDDDEFALDLRQWNDPYAFEDYVNEQDALFEEKLDDPFPSPTKLAAEQARVKKRMSAPLPKRLPLDDEEEETQDFKPAVTAPKKTGPVRIPGKCAAPIVPFKKSVVAQSPNLDSRSGPHFVAKKFPVIRAPKTRTQAQNEREVIAVMSEEEL